MKKIKSIVAVSALLLVFTFSAQSQVVKRVPVSSKVVVVKTKRPGKNYVWVDGNYYWNKKRKCYVWKKARWVKAKSKKRYVAGHWKKVNGGYIYVNPRWV